MTRRTYQDEEIRILWDSSLCIHVGRCIAVGGGVFDPKRRPWVELEHSSTDVIVSAVEACPTGALRYETLDGGPSETPDTPTTVVPWPNGPLMMRGEMSVEDRNGNTFLAGPRVALCRCGNSANQPFCDLAHRASRFRDNPRATSVTRTEAQSPDDIEEATLS